MVHTYKKKKPVPEWTIQDVEAVISAVNRSELSTTEAAMQYGVPKTCILRRIKSNIVMPP